MLISRLTIMALIASLLAVAFTGCGGAGSAKKDSSGAVPAVASMLPPSGNEAPSDDSIAEDNHNTEAYDEIVENEFVRSLTHPKSTFSVDVDTASYSNVRRMLNEGIKPPLGAVRIEEFVNYFPYSYPGPNDEHPFSINTELAPCPWQPEHQLVRIGLQGKKIPNHERSSSNLVFLLDVSGSMHGYDRLPLVQSAMKLLVKQLDERDRIAIVVYAGASGVVLPSTPAINQAKILTSIDLLTAGGSTNGGEGIELAYSIAEQNFIEGGINRVILCTDGDFNVGVTNQSELVRLISKKRESNIFLSVFGFGQGNLKDSTMEKLADKGNGNYAYIDSMLEAKKSLVQQMGSTLITIAKDVKIQVDFNPLRVDSYRLIGYENRMLANEDFADDTKDAGEIGAGHSVTAIYEIVPTGADSPARTDSPSQFVENQPKPGANPDTLLIVNLRYKSPEGTTSTEFNVPLDHPLDQQLETPSAELQFACAVAGMGMKLRDSKFAGSIEWDWIVDTAQQNIGNDKNGLRQEFVGLSKKARLMFQE